mmetsp:Transcript_26208/g.36503  ORF Transcript_26208/g.36503 Transcript_26208/m.36503 type:complete len:188 (-) Transcript_26208:270-833(-)|eukprot:CAMPEP_0184487274 /NCGR_PEP_ID=MMETSP0113_2-20130426/9663_1 /TAXON_ID=91329 /ORGANISM="Norrisiella sphaerica, Strain BC52" /LENGTH=187 /DNA_ID=CAMNT_0026869517 /DNA_START=37 /DNA_END=600 /DNA_ORIENTATION=+
MGSGGSKQAALRTVEKVNIDKFVGKWYVVGVIPTYFEKGAYNPCENYTWDSKSKKIKVDFTYNASSLTGKPKSLKQTLIPDGYPESSGRMTVSPFWPVKVPFLVMEMSPDYTNCMIGYPTRAYLWIMSRQPAMDKKIYDSYVESAKEQGYDVSKILNPEHNDTAQIKEKNTDSNAPAAEEAQKMPTE